MAELLRETEIDGRKLRVLQGDITEAETDAIVNAAGPEMQHGGGVAAAIVRAGGDVIREESNRIGYVSEGHCATTSGGNLPAEYVIHAVGPKGTDPDAEMKLSKAVTNALQEADRLDIGSISLPAISSGIFGFPKDDCARILLETARDWLENNPNTSVRQVDMVNIDDLTAGIFAETFDEMFGD